MADRLQSKQKVELVKSQESVFARLLFSQREETVG